jgi:hypothetical protein
MPPVGFETTIPASDRPQTYALVRTDTGVVLILRKKYAKYLQPLA